MRDKVLLINDLAGYGKVALSAMMPVLSHMGFDLHTLPTALVSNTLDYGKFEILETTDYMKHTLEVWEQLGFSFDAVCTGFIVSQEQMKLVADFCKVSREKGARIFADPIMGDDGKLYNGVTEETVGYMRELTAVSDVVMPNFTEASFIAGMFRERGEITGPEGKALLEELKKLGARSIVITSACVDGAMSVLGYDAQSGSDFLLPFEYIPVRFPGTGDIFSAVLAGSLLSGMSLEDSTKRAMDVVKNLILLNKDNGDKFKGIPVEQYLDAL